MNLRNGQFELCVSPATGRVMAYGPIGGPNVLWHNPRAPETPVVFPGWVNWGGDKVWIWPEDDWAKWNPESRHPPGDPSPVPHQVEGDGLRLRLISPVLANYGLRIVRDIALAPSGSRVTFSNRLEQAGPGRCAMPVAVWTVTQIPAAPHLFARLCPDAAPPGYESFPSTSWPKVERNGNIVTLHRPAAPWQKIGLDADLLAVPVAGHLFIAGTPVPPSAPPARFRRAQVFSDPDDSPFRLPGVPPYVELEFTSPLQPLAVGQSLSLTVTWELLRLTERETSAATTASGREGAPAGRPGKLVETVCSIHRSFRPQPLSAG